MKLDASDLRYVSSEEFRVLTAVEMGSKNHEVVPTSLIAQISGLRNGGVNKSIASLAKRNLVSKVQNSRYDGYRLTYGGYDYLAMRTLSKRDSMYSVGNQIGVGKESDIYIVADADGNEMVLKLHRLGRVSFRTIKEKRDYLGKRKSASWMYMSRLAAQKEWAFMKVLHEHGFPVPRPIDQARHTLLMELIDAYPLRQMAEVPSPGKLYSDLMDLIVHFARAGLIHGDFNEFNILIRRNTGEPVVIDFPQMVSTSHENAEWYFNRDVECIRTFFKRRFQYESSLYPKFKKTVVDSESDADFKLDVEVAASGFGRRDMKVLEQYMEEVRASEEVDQTEDEDFEADSEQEASTAGSTIDSETNTPSRNTNPTVSPTQGEPDAKLNEGIISTLKGLSIDSVDQDRPTDAESSSDPRPASPSLQLGQGNLKVSKQGVKERVASDLTKSRALQHRKYHSKRSVHSAGRPQGSKAKQDMRVKLDNSGFWA